MLGGYGVRAGHPRNWRGGCVGGAGWCEGIEVDEGGTIRSGTRSRDGLSHFTWTYSRTM